MSDKKILLYHRIRSVQTIKDFIDREFLNIKSQDLFDENKDFIFSQMSEADKTAYKESNGTYPTSGSDLNVNMILPCPCKLLIDPKFITAEVAINQTNLQVDDEDFYSFENEKVHEIIQEAAYSNEVDRRSPACQVIGWFKTLYRIFTQEDGHRWTNQNKYMESFSNISSDIISIQTNVGKNGGNFSIRLPFISVSKNQNYIIDALNRNTIENTESYGFLSEKYPIFVNSSEKVKYGVGGLDRINYNSNIDYYSLLFSSNDLLFISFNAELDERKNSNNVYFSVNAIKTGSYDMIGLVDEVKIIKNSQGAQVAIEVTGRDLMKLLIEDGSFFFNPSVVYDTECMFMNHNEIIARGDIVSVDEFAYTNTGDPMINPLNRMLGSRDLLNLISIFARKQNMELSFILKAVMNQLSNIQVVPGSIFNGFQNRTTVLDLQPKEE